MTRLPSQTARGHGTPQSVQFSVFLANRVGQFKELLDILAAESLDVLGLSIVDSTDWAVVRMVLSDSVKGRAVLTGRGLPFTESGILLVVLQSEPSLARACGVLLQAEINVHFAYPLTLRQDDRPIMVFHVDDTPLAASVLRSHEFVLLGEDDL